MKINDKEYVSDTGYVIEQDINIAGTHYFFAYDKNDNMPYLVGEKQIDGIIDSYNNCIASDNYIEAMKLWVEKIRQALIATEKKLSEVEDYQVLTTDDVEPITSADSIENKVVVIDSDVFLREAQYSQKQLVFVKGGLGASANSRGRTVFCDRIDDGAQQKFYRGEILGVIKPEKIPKWAINKIAELQRNFAEPVTAPPSSTANVIKR